MSLLNPDSDAPVDHMKLHKDVTNVLRMLVVGAATIFAAAMWVAAMAQDVETNKEELKEKADKAEVSAVIAILERIEKKVDDQGKDAQESKEALIRLETKVEAIEKELEDNGS